MFAGSRRYLTPFALSLSKGKAYTKIKINTAGGSPAASHFLLLRQKESNQRKGDPGLPPLRGALRCSTGQAAAELALRAQTVLAEIP